MADFFQQLVESDFMPHGHCYNWQSDILWSHALSDSIIATAYFVIPLVLLYIYLKRRSTEYVWVMILFAIFITGCGITHIFDVVTIWNPVYRLDAIFRIITALASIGTALILVKVAPNIIAIPSPQEWIAVNQELNAQLIQLREKDRIIEAFKEFASLTETLPQLVCTYQSDGKATFYNQQWYRYTGLDFEASLTRAFEQVIEPEQHAFSMRLWHEAMQGGKPFDMEVYIRRQDGAYRWHLVRSTPLKLNQADGLWVCTFTDIQDQKVRNEELEQKNRELSIINNDLDNFIYTASHDLKAPIANIEGLINLLSKRMASRLEASEKEIIGMMNVSISKFKGTIRDLAEMIKSQKEATEEPAPVTFEDILENVKVDLHELIAQSQARIESHFEVPQINYARKNLKSILYNLVSNAIKYRSTERSLRVEVNTEPTNDGYTLLMVRDNGLGMNQDQQNNLFRMFKRFHTHVEGAGIGLYIVKRIITNSGGRIEVESEVDQGTTFRIYLPDNT
jgi:PAS domain S-box-containing protein